METEEELMKNHRKEKKELQAKIQGMKNAIPKNDRKRRKQLAEEINKLEADLDHRHEEDLKQFQQTVRKQTEEDSATDGIAHIELKNEEESIKQPRVTKAQKRREKKAAQEKERSCRIAEAEVENLSGARHLENLKVEQILLARQLQMKPIPSDGHCMYRAIEDQLKRQNSLLTLTDLRMQTAEYMKNNEEEFLPFLINPNTGNTYTHDEYQKYCSDIANTAAWGGQLELYEICLWTWRTL
ncbi:deubiquitinase OTUD6B isoform X2 [Protopterus annectens]|uniref:deubiquitinase OTUD6B isoform X2 n=1 Tax=Protopterus annectens TaxID=7888 RepID=UPI001CF98DD4|nr:deubiquitinase OTUD6B isoform X2 [Protopterus annectens]